MFVARGVGVAEEISELEVDYVEDGDSDGDNHDRPDGWTTDEEAEGLRGGARSKWAGPTKWPPWGT